MIRNYKVILLAITMIFVSFIPPTVVAEETVMNLTLEDAVKMGMENSIQLKQVKNQIDLSDVANDRTKYLSKKMDDGKDRIKQGSSQINDAQSALNAGIAPQDVHLPNGTVIPAGTNVNSLPFLTDEDYSGKG